MWKKERYNIHCQVNPKASLYDIPCTKKDQFQWDLKIEYLQIQETVNYSLTIK